MAKYEMAWGPYGQPGRPREVIGHKSYPCMMYLVKRAATGGGVEVVEYREAKSQTERQNLESRGYVNGLAEAAAALAEREQDTAIASAERAYRDRNMSDAAKAEIEAAENATTQHLADIPETPINTKRGKDKAPGKGELVEPK